MRRRDFLALLGGAAIGWPVDARAQRKAMPVIGLLGFASLDRTAWLTAFRQTLRDAGYAEGENIAIEYRSWEGRPDLLPALAADLVTRNVDVIVATGGTLAARAAKNATATIPIVFETGADPVKNELVVSFARPGGNLTGITIITGELNPKRFELLTELVPQAKTIALLLNPTNAGAERVARDVQDAARSKGIQLAIVRAAAEDEFEAAFTTMVEQHSGAMLVGNDPFFFSRRDRLVALAARHALPAIYEWREFAEAGGLMSYGTNISAMYRQAGIYVARILKGEKPADLPVVQPTHFELVINLKTANALGLTIPQSLLARADEVIE
jgi:putative tryptophan/tyrosine transport system substrate-binding protein